MVLIANPNIPPKDDTWSVVELIGQSPPVDCTAPYDPSTIAGKTILITGGASGFGAAFARHWARHGAHIVLGDVNDKAGEALTAELRIAYPSQTFVYQHCDVTSWADQVSLYRFAMSSSPSGSIHTVVAAAGIVELANPTSGQHFDFPTSSLSSSDMIPSPPPLRVINVNLMGVMYTTHLALHFLPLNKPNKGAGSDSHILLISSIAGLLPLPGQTEYAASKHAVIGLFRTLRATAWSTQQIRVNCLAPYFVDTPLLPPAAHALLAGGVLAKLEDVVNAATRLVADEEIRGRALAIGPRVVFDEEGMPKQNPVQPHGVWEVYGHDYERVEVFTWRYLKMINLMRQARGWWGLAKDLLAIFTGRKGGSRN
ncbi:uncharacterized protein CTHT_0014720 [Thermochaetoides thermophila DSM 1495]|uniref:NAD(P)-binding protein n=1 Tax=Chaetomium thermophilum (strain DSM 1495 / CBS 144.50 / IMI 039719) TaxID=759272 RepID=G0S1T2_CHATD|nr:hypothetical protein CTHT_0014720 [Thermochaetoides thermophila DSM 1495]EGS22992.1 hypothetical protein CTHT_0014720 [Thermochaetoides thermophila DSM 1495]